MVIIIVGASCTGKTLMAQRLLEKHKMPYLSMDHIKMGLFRGGHDCGFTPLSSDALIEEQLWPVLKGIVMTVIENGQNLILEGCYMMPERLKEFTDDYLRHIIPVFMGFSPDYIRRHFETGILAHRSIIEHRILPEERSADEFIAENDLIRSHCHAASVTYFEIDSDYDENTAKIYRWIDERVAAQ